MQSDNDTSKKYHLPTPDERIEAAALRRRAQEVRQQIETERERLDREKRERQEAERRRAHADFLDKEFTEADRDRIKDLTRAAVRAGNFEVEILRFPADYLDDNGRAVNNADRTWPNYLTGYARSICEAYIDIAQPLGYRLVARVLDYRDGNIGDIGLFLRW